MSQGGLPSNFQQHQGVCSMPQTSLSFLLMVGGCQLLTHFSQFTVSQLLTLQSLSAVPHMERTQLQTLEEHGSDLRLQFQLPSNKMTRTIPQIWKVFNIFSSLGQKNTGRRGKQGGHVLPQWGQKDCAPLAQQVEGGSVLLEQPMQWRRIIGGCPCSVQFLATSRLDTPSIKDKVSPLYYYEA